MAGALRQGDLIGIFATSAERETLDRVQAVMAVIEGHAEHVMDAVAPDLLPSLPKLRGALDRRRKSQSGLSRLLAKLLGLELKLRQYEQGKYFCDAIVERGRHRGAGPRVLAAEALPTLRRAARSADLAAPGRARTGAASALERVEAPRVLRRRGARAAPRSCEAQPRARRPGP